MRQLQFTFHNVSIKTHIFHARPPFPPSFTFHNVSIKTSQQLSDFLDAYLIYIPQCFY